MLRCFGGYRTTILMSVLSTIGSSLVPFAVSHNFVLLIVLRLILGATLSLAFPLIGTVISSWSAATESSIFVSVLTGYLQLCAIFSMTITGFFSAKVGWPSVFYIHSGAMVLLLAFWAYFYRDDIFRHRFVSEVEIRKISVGKEINKVLKKETIPYRKIVASRPIQVVWIAAGGNYLAAQFALTFWPSYLVRSLGYSLESAGFLAVIPLSLQFLAKLVAGFIGDRLHCLSDLRKIKLMNTIAFFGSAVFFVLAAAIPAEEYATMNLVFIICAIIILGFNAGGFPKAGLMCSKQFSRFVMSTIQLILCVTLCVGSFVVPLLTPNSTSDEYNVVFYIYAAALLVSNIVFVMFASAEPQPFTEQSS
ncbi:hypothetical protein M3Y94_00756700 [Aphelenchoides besseyi]|nr:hypothetical protein M3Y94_00756700 [Aphelenchoides besseyi]